MLICNYNAKINNPIIHSNIKRFLKDGNGQNKSYQKLKIMTTTIKDDRWLFSVVWIDLFFFSFRGLDE